jgi:8-oxo-dGTP pyrophosphatase MutT (NUDIX family)
MALSKTIKLDGISAWLVVSAGLMLAAGCQVRATPPCPGFGSEERAPSAGCLALHNGKLLVVQDLAGQVSLPGGTSENSESAQCTAFRETWEETGLQLAPGRLLKVFETGFHLYRCEHHAGSGKLDPPPRLEVRDAFYLTPAEFGDWEWRFPGQQPVLEQLVEQEVRN